MKRVIITGGTGFVGANLVRRLLADGHEVHLLVREGHQSWRIAEIEAAVQWHLGKWSDASEADAVMKKVRPEWIFHLAAHGAYSWQKDAVEMMQTNVLQTVNMVEAALRVGFEAFIHTGSSSEYGFKDHPPAEDEWLEPNSAYAVAKAAATQYCRHAAQRSGAHIVTLRLYSAFGPWEDPERLLPTLIRHGEQGDWPPLADPNIARDFVYVDDVSDACILAAQRRPRAEGTVYNLGTGVQTTLREVAEVAQRVFEIPAEPRWGSMPARAWDTRVWVADSTRIRRELGWQPRFTFESGLRRMIDWWRATPSIPRSTR